jgi:hypothetical protein
MHPKLLGRTPIRGCTLCRIDETLIAFMPPPDDMIEYLLTGVRFALEPSRLNLYSGLSRRFGYSGCDSSVARLERD